MRDPHVRDMLRKKTTSDRAASREEAKLAQLEVDSMTPLYDGCNNPEVTRLSFTLELLKMKAKNKWTDTSLDELLKYLKKVLPVGSLCPTSVEEAKKIVYRNEHTEKPSVQSAMFHDIKRPERKLHRKLYGTFRSLHVNNDIS